MPLELEREARKRANKLARKGKLRRHRGEPVKDAKDRYVYGVLRKTGWVPPRER